jgi:hypothetical protein
MLAGLLPGVGAFCDAPIISIAGPSPRKEKSRGTPDFLSHDKDRWALDLLQRGRPERRADASLAARISLVIADVRAALRPAFRSLSPRRARLPGLRTQRLAGPEAVQIYVRSHRFRDRRFYMQDYGGPVGFRMALAHPEQTSTTSRCAEKTLSKSVDLTTHLPRA